MLFFKATTATAAARLGIGARGVVFGIAGWVRFFEFWHRVYCFVIYIGCGNRRHSNSQGAEERGLLYIEQDGALGAVL